MPLNINSDKPPPRFVGFGGFFLRFFPALQGVLAAAVLTMRCWKSHERMMLVACLGRTPRLFLDFLSSPSRREVRSRFTCQGGGTGRELAENGDGQPKTRAEPTQKMSKTSPKWEWGEGKKQALAGSIQTSFFPQKICIKSTFSPRISIYYLHFFCQSFAKGSGLFLPAMAPAS